MNTPFSPLPDAPSRNWVDLYAPKALQPWLRLGRFDRPIGIWLLFLPGLMGLLFGWSGLWTEFPIVKILYFAVGAGLMRAAGCAFNDWVDRDLDAKVERTRHRPLASGQISPKGAFAFMGFACFLSLLILLQLGPIAIGLGVASLALVAAYPFMKRLTFWPQVWLGLTFNWGFLMGFAAESQTLTLAVVVFYAGLIFWTVGYDTIYALQDIEDDAMVGIKSSALALGARVREGVAAFYGAAFFLTLLAGLMAGQHLIYFIGLLGVGAHLFWQVWQLWKTGPDTDKSVPPNLAPTLAPNLALRLFKSNRTTGLLWVAALLAARLLMA